MKRKVTDLLPNEAILISNDAERDAILQLMEDAGWLWNDGTNAIKYAPKLFTKYALGYKTIGNDGIMIILPTLGVFKNCTTYPATDFIGSDGEMERGITIVKQNGEVISDETIATLRAEKSELIEALRSILEANESEDLVQVVYLMTGIASQTLAKYETK
jgi:hypothetical protein